MVLPGGVFPGGAFPGGVFPGGAFPGGVLPGGVFPGGVFPAGAPAEDFRTVLPERGNSPATFNAASTCTGVFGGPTSVTSHRFAGLAPVPGGVLPGGVLPGGVLPGGVLPGGVLPGGVLVAPPRIFRVTRGFPLFFLRLVTDILLLGDKLTMGVYPESEREIKLGN